MPIDLAKVATMAAAAKQSPAPQPPPPPAKRPGKIERLEADIIRAATAAEVMRAKDRADRYVRRRMRPSVKKSYYSPHESAVLGKVFRLARYAATQPMDAPVDDAFLAAADEAYRLEQAEWQARLATLQAQECEEAPMSS